MSRSDYPPGYDDSHSPLYTPQGGNYPPPPAYGFPSYGGGQPGQPSAPYPGQPAGYAPPGPYPGQPYPGGHPGAGYPTPPPMPPVIPPTIPSDVLSSGDEFAAAGSNWDSLSVRHAFIRKVYLILAAQLLVTTAVVAIFTFVRPVRLFVQQNQWVYWASYAVYIVTHLVLVCCKGPRRKFPWNVILLGIFVFKYPYPSLGTTDLNIITIAPFYANGCRALFFYISESTLAFSYMTGSISSFYNTKAVFLALGITAVVCIAVTVFCFQTKVDFTKCQGLFCILGIVMLVVGIITAIVLSFKYIPWLHMLYAALGAIVFTLFLAYHTQLLIGNRKHSISEEEYVFAALSIYVDIVQIFLFLLQIIGASTK